MPLNIVLVEPQIPQNTGNISRTCAATGSTLHLIEPLGFSVDDRALKRAGLDYWHLLDIYYYSCLEEFFEKNKEGDFYFSTTKGNILHSQISYTENSFLFFGKETAGLPDNLLEKYPDRCIRIPIIKGARSLNLSNSVAIVVYEALRQVGYPAKNTSFLPDIK